MTCINLVEKYDFKHKIVVDVTVMFVMIRQLMLIDILEDNYLNGKNFSNVYTWSPTKL